MSRVFADTFYYLALLNPNDDAQQKAIDFTTRFVGTMVTTDWVLTELADGLCSSATRRLAVQFIKNLRDDRPIRIIPASRKILDRGLSLYRNRSDKAWSLTDCISFVVMQDCRIVDALTGDRHLEQAGFKAILK